MSNIPAGPGKNVASWCWAHSHLQCPDTHTVCSGVLIVRKRVDDHVSGVLKCSLDCLSAHRDPQVFQVLQAHLALL